MIVPLWSCVCALNALQNSMMFTPCWPRAGPTGGAGLAAPAGTWSLISVRTFFVTVLRRVSEDAAGIAQRAADTCGADLPPLRCALSAPSNLLHLIEANLDRRLAAEDR